MPPLRHGALLWVDVPRPAAGGDPLDGEGGTRTDQVGIHSMDEDQVGGSTRWRRGDEDQVGDPLDGEGGARTSVMA